MTSTRGVPSTTPAVSGFDVTRVRRDFPFLQTRVNDRPVVYFDSAASSQRPRAVVEAEADFALLGYANVHRGVHSLSQRATTAFDSARERLRGFIGARDASEIVFTAGATASLNLVARSWARSRLGPGDEILVTEMEHHSNFVPWQLVAEETGARLRAIPVSDAGGLDLDQAADLITGRTRIVAVAHVSNVLGTVNPVARLAELTHAVGGVLVVDGAQAVPHLRVDVTALGCDFYAASAHKMYGPNGIGFLWGRRELLEAMPPWQAGGGMIEMVSIERSTWAPLPAKFEAGTPPITQAIGLQAAIDYIEGLDRAGLEAHERLLVSEAARRLGELSGVRVIGFGPGRVGLVSFVMDNVHPHDVGTILDLKGVAVRASHHCAQPLMRRLGISGTVRASFGAYNTMEELDLLVAGVEEAREVFAG